MRRRDFIAALLGGAAAGRSLDVLAQSEKMPRIGVLVAQSVPHPFPDAFRASMQQLGYVEGRNIAIDWRYGDGLYDRAVERANELVKLGVDVIAAHHTPAVKASMSVTKTIPIVMAPAGAPLQTGMVASLARPGGNVTGLSAMEAELGGKRIALLRDVIPDLKSVAVLGSRSDPFTVPYVKDAQAGATQAGIALHPVLIDGLNDLESAFASMSAAGAQAVMIQPIFGPHDVPITTLARKHRIAIMSTYRATTLAGGVMSYSAAHTALFRRSATFVDKILKGAKPGELPVEQPTQFELMVNLKTAKELGLAISEAFLLNVDEVIE